MRVLVTFAVDAEFAPWRKLRNFRKEEIVASGHSGGSYVTYRTQFESAFLDVGFTGIGWIGLNEGLLHLLSKKPDVWISSGLAGGLRDPFRPGDVFAPGALLEESTRASLQAERLEVNAELRQLALRGGAKDAGCLLSMRQILTNAGDKKVQASQADCVDMESFHVVKEAIRLGTPSVVVRAISDSAEENLPIDFNRVLSSRNQVSVPKVVLQVARDPFAIPALIRFGKQSRMAAEKLVEFLDRYLEVLLVDYRAMAKEAVS